MTFEERLEALTQTVELLAHMQIEAEKRFEERHAKFEERQSKTEALLRRAIRDGIRAARHERKKRQEMESRLDEKMTQLAAAQLITEERNQQIQKNLDVLIRTITMKNGGSQQR
jgi:hypothetical protein